MAKAERAGVGYAVTSVLVVFDHPQTFIERDLGILRERYEVRTLVYSGKASIGQLWRDIRRADAVVCWFVLGYAATAVMFSRLQGKPCMLIAGGWDVVTLPEMHYGALLVRYRRPITKFALDHARMVLVVSMSLQRTVNELTSRSTTLAYHGFDLEFFCPGPNRGEVILTVAAVSAQTIPLKGLDTFVEVARRMPQNQFRIAGEIRDGVGRQFSRSAPGNVEFLGRLSATDLVQEYQRARVYVQLSAQESFGCALAEAMLCGCTPVVTNRGAMPEVAGDAAYYVPYADPELTIEAIRDAMHDPRGDQARARVIERFSVESRRQVLFQTIERCLSHEVDIRSRSGEV